MARRVIQVFLPEAAAAGVGELLDGREILGTWRDCVADNRVALHVVVRAEEAEPIMDRLEQKFAAADGFHMLLLPVEAVVPRPDDDEETNDDGNGPDNDAREAFRVSREELYGDIAEALGIDRVFIAMTLLSAIVAAVGLMRDDVAVIVGAMVIAPLLGPNVAMALATTLGDLKLLRRALCTNVVGVALAAATALLAGMTLSFDPEVTAMASRTQLGISDLVLALAAGSAGTLAFTRGLPSAVIGVMVAVALLPPLVTAGLLLAAGRVAAASGALLLVTANVVCVNLAGVATFLAQGVRPRTWWEDERAKKSSRIAIVIWFLLLLVLGAIVYATR